MNIEGLTDEEKLIAIVKACGWSDVGRHQPRPEFMEQPDAPFIRGHAPGSSMWNVPPDYLNDLNAIAEAFDHARTTDRAWYFTLHKKLDGLVAIANSREDSDPIATADATARQRADAFLLTLP